MALNSPGSHAGITRLKIMREGGEKKGIPFVFHRVDEIPAHAEGRKFETRKTSEGGNVHYELFRSVTGFVTGVRAEEASFGNETVTTLILRIQDGPDTYDLAVGKLDGRMAMDVLTRLLNPVFQIDLRSTLTPFYSEKDGRESSGISVQNGADKILYTRDSEYLAVFPDAETTTFEGKTLWSFKRRANALFEAAKARFEKPFERKSPPVVPIPSPDHVFPTSEAHTPAPAVTGAAAMPTTAPADTDDLPF